jgi:aryl-alcohol dehydrogenase-like predicted oxidoreductase
VEYTDLGATGLQVSRICLAMMNGGVDGEVDVGSLRRPGA